MKKIISLILFVCFTFCGNIRAQVDFGSEDFLSGKNIKMQRNFLNNLIVIGSKLDFSGSSYEDIAMFGININFNGSSNKDVYIAGDTVKISGNIKGNLRVLARNLTIDKLRVNGSVNIVSPEIVMSDSVQCDKVSKIWSRNAQIGGHYRILHIKTKNIIFSKNIDIQDSLFVQSKEKPAIPLNVLKHCHFVYQPQLPQKSQFFLSSKFRKLYSFLSLCFPFLLMILLTPRVLNETIEIIEKNPAWIFFSGLLLLILTPVILILVMITVVGAPLGLIFFIMYLSLLYLCRGITCIVLGKMFFKKLKEGKIKIILSIFLGTGIFVLLTTIPKISYFIQVIFIIFGFGGLVIGRIRMFLKLRKENLI